MRLNLLILLIFILSIQVAKSQTAFTISQTRGCLLPPSNSFMYTISVTNAPGCNSSPNFNLRDENGNTVPNSGFGPSSFSNSFTTTTLGVTKYFLVCNSTTGGAFVTGSFSITGLTSSTPKFTLSACAGSQLSVKLNNPTFDKYNIDWGDFSNTIVGNTLSPIPHIYSNEVTKTLTVTGFYEYTVAGVGTVTSCRKDSVATSVLFAALTAPGFNQLSVENISSLSGVALLTISVSGKLKYSQYRSDPINPFTSKDTLQGLSNGFHIYSVSGLNTATQSYCFKLEAFDDCGTTPISSQEICTLSISGTAKSDGNHITAGIYKNPAFLIITSTGFSSSNLGSIALSTIDSNVSCGESYTYRATATETTPTTKVSISAPLSLIAIKTIAGLAPPDNFIASYGATDEKIILSWTPLTVTSTTLVISNNQNKLVSTISVTSSDSTYRPPTPYSECYYIKIKSTCAQGDSSKACPPNIDAFASGLESNTITWSNAVVSNSIVSSTYDLLFYAQGQGNVPYHTITGLTSNYSHILSTIDPLDTISQVLYYRVITNNKGKEIRSAFKRVKQDLRFWAPNAFTPNGDGLNDSFAPKGLFWDKYELSIYNRWGQTVFVTTDKHKGWDGGQFNPDLYHYVYKVEDQYGGILENHGTFQLIR